MHSPVVMFCSVGKFDGTDFRCDGRIPSAPGVYGPFDRNYIRVRLPTHTFFSYNFSSCCRGLNKVGRDGVGTAQTESVKFMRPIAVPSPYCVPVGLAR